MKRGLSHHYLRLARSEAYDPSQRRIRNSVVGQAAEECAFDEPIAGTHGDDTGAVELPDSAPATPAHEQHADSARIVANPLREDDPHPAIVTAVKRFGVVGLTASAVCAALLRWCNSLLR